MNTLPTPEVGAYFLTSYLVPTPEVEGGGNVGLFISKRIMIGLVYEPKAPMICCIIAISRLIRNFFLLADNDNTDSNSSINGNSSVNGDNHHKRKLSQQILRFGRCFGDRWYCIR